MNTLLLLLACSGSHGSSADTLALAHATVDGTEAGQYFGYIVDNAGDVNGDGHLDLITGTLRPDDFTGAVYLFYGPYDDSPDLSLANATRTGAAPEDNLGMSVAGVGDLDQDGFDDVIFGSRYHDGAAGVDVGGVYLAYGPMSGGSRPMDDGDLLVEGEVENGRAGRIVDGGEDLTGDGVPDLLTGAPLAHGSGAAYIIPGPIDASITLASSHRLMGEASADRTGQTVSIAGDVDGDGLADILVGAMENDAGGQEAGRVYLVLGPVTGNASLTEIATATITGEAAGDKLGDLNGAAPAGDINGDGLGDIVLAAKYHDQSGDDSGAIYLFNGPLTGELSAGEAEGKWVGEQAGDLAGYHVAAAGDVDGDGLGDVVVGSAWADLDGVDSGAVYVLWGPANGRASLANAPVRLSGEAASDRAGHAVASAGDQDGDGLPDLFVSGVARNDETGRVYLVLANQL